MQLIATQRQATCERVSLESDKATCHSLGTEKQGDY